MKNILYLFSLLSLSFLFSCSSDDEDIFPDNLLAKLTVDESYYDGYTNTDIYYYITDVDGNLLSEAVEATNGIQEYEFERPEGFTGDRISLVRVRIYNNTGNISISTFANVKTGIFKVLDNNSYYSNLEGREVNMNFSNIPAHDYFLLSSGNTSARGNYIYDSFTSKFYDDEAYVYLKNGTEGFYGNYKLSAGSSQLLDLSDMSSEMQLYNPIAKNDENIYYLHVYGYEGDFYGRRNSYFRSNNTSSSFMFHIPNDKRHINFRTTAYSYNWDKNYGYNKFGSIPDIVDNMQNEILIQNPEMKEFDFMVSGDYDMKSAYWRWRDDNDTQITLWVNGVENGNAVPEIPASLASRGVILNAQGKEVNLNIVLYDYSHVSSYDEYINKAFKQSSDAKFYEGINYSRFISTETYYNGKKGKKINSPIFEELNEYLH